MGFMQYLEYFHISTSNHNGLEPSKITPRTKYERQIPDEVVALIFKSLPYQMQLSVIPQVCYQFYVISRPFSQDCYSVHRFIPKMKEITPYQGDAFFVIHFTENYEISIHRFFSHAKRSFMQVLCKVSLDLYFSEKDSHNFQISKFTEFHKETGCGQPEISSSTLEISGEVKSATLEDADMPYSRTIFLIDHRFKKFFQTKGEVVLSFSSDLDDRFKWFAERAFPGVETNILTHHNLRMLSHEENEDCPL